MKYIKTLLIASTLTVSMSTIANDTDVLNTEAITAIQNFNLENRNNSDWVHICKTRYSESYARASVSKTQYEGYVILNRFTVYPECSGERQSLAITRNLSNDDFELFLLREDSNDTVVDRSSRSSLRSYPSAGTYYWAVRNLGGGTGDGRIYFETGLTK